jgi:branched-chain amino acid transport system substrate-binding protein
MGGIALLITAGLGVSACGSGGSSSGSDEAGGTVTVGILTSLTGSAAAGFGPSVELGAKARFEAQNAAGGVNGTKIKWVVADDKSTPEGALAGAKDLVQNQKVSAVISMSSFISGAQPFLLQQKMPTIGGSFSGNDWSNSKNTNMFSSAGSNNYDLSATTIPGYLKNKGVKKLGLLAYAGSASSTLVVKSVATAAENVGLDVAYQNENLAFGSTDVGAVAIGMRDAGVDGVYLPVIAPTAFALIGALNQLGVKLVATLLPTGYGNELLSQPAAVQAAQGISFTTTMAPVELQTQATQKVVDNLKTYANVTTVPGFGMYNAYVAADAYIRGLEANDGKSDTQSFIDNMRKVSDFTAGGLYTVPINFAEFGDLSPGVGPGNCTYVSTLQGDGFVPDPSAAPFCGELVN